MATLDSFRAARWTRTANLLLQAILFLTLCFGLNYLAAHYAWRHDLTRHRKYSLSPETRAWLMKLDRPVQAIVTVGSQSGPDGAIIESPELEDIRALLREYSLATEANLNPAQNKDGRFSYAELDVYQQRTQAVQLGRDRPELARPDLVIFRDAAGLSNRAVAFSELYRTRQREDGSEIREFVGEERFTSAILEVSSLEQKKVYFLTDHRELRIDDVSPLGLSVLADDLKLRNLAVAPLSLAGEAAGSARPVPEDASLVIVAGAVSVEPPVQEQLRQYLSRSTNPGRMIVMLRHGFPNHGLQKLIAEWRITPVDDQIVEPGTSQITDNDDLRIGSFDPTHPITAALFENNLTILVGPTRSLLPISPDAAAGSVNVMPIAATSRQAWGESNYRNPPFGFDPGVDLKGQAGMEPRDRLAIAITSERARPGNALQFSVASGRLLVIGTTDIMTNERMNLLGNRTFARDAIEWAVGRETRLSVPARPVERFQLALSQDELARLRLSLQFLLPGAVAFLGLLVYWTRRK